MTISDWLYCLLCRCVGDLWLAVSLLFRYSFEGALQAIYGFDRDPLECEGEGKACLFHDGDDVLKELDVEKRSFLHRLHCALHILCSTAHWMLFCPTLAGESPLMIVLLPSLRVHVSLLMWLSVLCIIAPKQLFVAVVVTTDWLDTECCIFHTVLAACVIWHCFVIWVIGYVL